MIFLPRYPAAPPYGLIDEVIYYGRSVHMASYAFYCVDLLTGDVTFLPVASFPAVPPAGPAGGDLAGTYPNPTVATVSDSALSVNVPVMTAGVLPAVDGSLLTALPPPPSLVSGPGGLDATGLLDINLGVAAGALVAVWASAGAAGYLVVTQLSGTHWHVQSSAGAADQFLNVFYIAY